jgi:antitoxin (DNA-binding transcriptional repressor) of toxin-antitoxin stability system
MQTLNIREFRNTIPHLRETLAVEHELLLVRNGEPIARILPVEPAIKRPKLESLQWLRDMNPRMSVPSEVLIREDRDRRGT